MRATVNEIAGEWIAAEIEQSRPLLRYHETEIDHFTAWLRCYGLKLPAIGQVVAGYLLDRAADGASFANLTRAADAIAFCHDVILRSYLDLRPIRAVLALVEAQTAPNRTLN